MYAPAALCALATLAVVALLAVIAHMLLRPEPADPPTVEPTADVAIPAAAVTLCPLDPDWDWRNAARLADLAAGIGQLHGQYDGVMWSWSDEPVGEEADARELVTAP